MLFNFRKYASVVALIALMGLNMSAASIDVNTARSTANSFLKRHVASPGAINSPSMADIKLVHAETSSVDRNAKTYYAFNLAHKIFDYDYIFRTNTSTYVNVELLNEFVQNLDNDEILWSSDLYSLSNSFCPYPLYLYGRGNGILLSKKLVDIILCEGISYLYLEKCDDWLIGNILNSYWIKQGKNYLDYIKGYHHGWYKCVPEEQPNNHKLCVYGNRNNSWEFVNKFITIQTKRYRERHLENEQSKELHKTFEDNEYNNEELNKLVEDNFKYSERPSVFIGSILGYTDYEEWKNCNKMELFNYQVKHKASDDEEYGKDTKWL